MDDKSTAFSTFIDLSLDYDVRINSENGDIEIELRCNRPRMGVIRRISKYDIPKDSIRRDRVINMMMRIMKEQLTDMVHQSYERSKPNE